MSRFSYEEKLSRFAAGEYDLIVGTQMVAKGLDFENVTLAAVLSADQALYSDDFRSYERAFSLLNTGGRPNPAEAATRERLSYKHTRRKTRFFSWRLRRIIFPSSVPKSRCAKTMLYPPFVDICMIGFVGSSQDKVRQASEAFLKMLRELAAAEYAALPMRVFPPTSGCRCEGERKISVQNSHEMPEQQTVPGISFQTACSIPAGTPFFRRFRVCGYESGFCFIIYMILESRDHPWLFETL